MVCGFVFQNFFGRGATTSQSIVMMEGFPRGFTADTLEHVEIPDNLRTLDPQKLSILGAPKAKEK
jgi:hypothetical protein